MKGKGEKETKTLYNLVFLSEMWRDESHKVIDKPNGRNSALSQSQIMV